MKIQVWPKRRDFDGRYEVKSTFLPKPNIILWSWRKFWVERFALNQSWKFGSGRKPFLCQCKKLTQRRLFPQSRFWDAGMEFRDVGCVRISFAINSNVFSNHSDSKSIKFYWNRHKIHILALFYSRSTALSGRYLYCRMRFCARHPKYEW